MLSFEQAEIIEKWKQTGIIKKLSDRDILRMGDELSINYFCSDGRTDFCCHLRGCGHPESDPFRIYGGPIDLAPSFNEFDGNGAKFILKKILRGIKLRGTSVVRMGWHLPCGLLRDSGHSNEDIPGLAYEAKNFLLKELPLLGESPENVIVRNYLHTRKARMGGGQEQNTYKLILPVV